MPDDTEPQLCWCHAVWGLTVPAGPGPSGLCDHCAADPACKNRHYADALSQPAPPQPAALFD